MNEYKYTYPGPSLQWLQHLLPLLCVMLLLTTAGCRKEDMSGGRQLKFSFDSTSQPDPDAIREIEVFVFDNQLRLISRATAGIDGTLSLDNLQSPTLHCIAWGNCNDDSLEFSTLQPGDPLGKAYLALTPLSPARAGTQYLNTPPNLFWGAIRTDNNTTAGNGQTIPLMMQPVTASIYITISGLPEITGTTAGNYTLEVSRSASRIDFEGKPGGTAVHCLTGTFNAQKEYIVPPFRLFPPVAGKGIKIAVFHNGKLLKNITQTSDRRPILPEAGKALKLLIVFSDDGDVEVRQPGWSPTDIEVVYPR